MHEDLKSIGVDAAQSALNAGGLLVQMQFPFYSGGYSYTHVLHTAKGKSFRVSKQTVAQLHIPKRTALQCAARGCDGCKVCLPHNDRVEGRAACGASLSHAGLCGKR